MRKFERVDSIGGRTPTVLVVEDEFLVRTVVADELRSAGYTVFEAGDCSEALQALATQPEIKIVLTDIALPGSLDGNELIRVMRKDYPDIIVVAATGNTNFGPVEGVLRKPFDPGEAVALVQNLLHPRQTVEPT